MDTLDIPFTIKALCDAGLTQTSIGTEIGVSQSTVSDALSGKSSTKRPSYKFMSGLERLATKHNVPTRPPAQSQPQ